MSLSNKTVCDILETARDLEASLGLPPYSLMSIPVETLALKGADTLAFGLAENTDVLQGAIGIYLHDNYALKDMEKYFRYSKEAAGLYEEDFRRFLDDRLKFHKYPGKLQEWKLYKSGMVAGALMRIIESFNLKFQIANADVIFIHRPDLFTRQNQSLYMLMLLYKQTEAVQI
jgi:hypothetical protein